MHTQPNLDIHIGQYHKTGVHSMALYCAVTSYSCFCVLKLLPIHILIVEADDHAITAYRSA